LWLWYTPFICFTLNIGSTPDINEYFYETKERMSHKNKCRIPTSLSLMLVFIFFSFIASAQNKGWVLEKKLNKPLAGVNIVSTDSRVLSVTNGKGEFNLRNLTVKNGKDTLSFSHIGYAPRKISLSELKEMGYLVLLTEDDRLLHEVTVVSEKLQLQPEIRYKQLKSLKEGLFSVGSVLIGGKICVIGGDASSGEDLILRALDEYGDDVMSHLNRSISWQEFSGSLYIYDLQTDSWTNSSLKFDKRAYHGIQYFKGKIYVFGGKGLSRDGRSEYLDNKIEVYDIKHNSILADHSNPHQAINFASFVYDNNLIVMGGSTKLKADGEKDYSNKVHICNLKTGYWYELEDMPTGKETKGVLIGNTIYLTGGFQSKPLKAIETYNVVTGKWNIESRELFYEVERPGVTTNGNIIYIFEDGKIQTYNIETKELNVYLIDLALKYSELFYANNKLYILGGYYQDEFSIEPSSNLYSIDLNEFKRTETHNEAGVRTESE
jgi:hypothetical protein